MTAPPPGLGVDSMMEVINSYQLHLQSFRESDRRREELVSHLVASYKDIYIKYQQKCDDYEQERHSTGMWQRESRNMERQLTELKLANESNPLVYVVIDGDGAVFRDDLLLRGEEGGADAAFRLLMEVKKHVKATYPDSPVEDWTIMVHVILNLEGLARTLHATGVVQDGLRDLTAFARAFGQAQSLFSFIDVGPGKERTDHKIRETLRVMIRLTQCKHVVFGPCHDNGYLPVLEPYKRDPAFSSKISLLECTQATPGFISLGLRRISFPTVFRSEPFARPEMFNRPSVATLRNGSIPSAGMLGQPFQIMSPQSTGSMAESSSASDTLVSTTPKVVSAPLQPQQQQPAPSPAPVTAPGPAPAPAPASAASPAAQSPATPSSYAAVGKVPAAKTINIAPKKPAPALKFYFVNADSERIDDDLPRANPGAEKRYMEKKDRNGRNFCNSYHLLGYCEDGDEYCKYEHGDKLPPGELLVQMQRARGTYCSNGIGCDDFDCYYSHHCRFGRDCGLGHRCKFNDTHHMDLRRAVKIFEDGTKEVVNN